MVSVMRLSRFASGVFVVVVSLAVFSSAVFSAFVLPVILLIIVFKLLLVALGFCFFKGVFIRLYFSEKTKC